MQMTSLFPFQLQRCSVAEALTAHSSNIQEWVDERGLATSVPKSTITLFTPQFAQSNTHPQVILNNSMLPLEKTPLIPTVAFDSRFKFWAHIKSIVTRTSLCINIHKALTGTNWGQQKENIPITYIYIYPLSNPFSCIQLPFGFTTIPN